MKRKRNVFLTIGKVILGIWVVFLIVVIISNSGSGAVLGIVFLVLTVLFSAIGFIRSRTKRKRSEQMNQIKDGQGTAVSGLSSDAGERPSIVSQTGTPTGLSLSSEGTNQSPKSASSSPAIHEDRIATQTGDPTGPLFSSEGTNQSPKPTSSSPAIHEDKPVEIVPGGQPQSTRIVVKVSSKMFLCVNMHTNADGAEKCAVCHLPVIDVRREIDTLRERLAQKTVFVKPKVVAAFYGVGGAGGKVVQQLSISIAPSSKSVSFSYFDSSVQESTESGDRNALLRRYKLGSASAGGTVFCGIGESNAIADSGLVSEIRLSGCREPDEKQILFFISAMGGGTGSGASPCIAATCRSINPKAITISIAVLPSGSEPPQAHFNAYYGVSRLLNYEGARSVDLLLLVDYDRLRQVRGVGKGGWELKMEDFLTHALGLIGVVFSNSNFIPVCRMARGLKIQAVVPCLAVGRSIEIFGNLTNVLDSALTLPLAPLDKSSVSLSCLLLSIPKRLTDMFPENSVTEEFLAWNKRYFPGLRASLFQIVQTDEHSDRIDCCVLLGGNTLDSAMRQTKSGYVDFKAYLQRSGQWEMCGLDERKVETAEETIRAYNSAIDPR